MKFAKVTIQLENSTVFHILILNITVDKLFKVSTELIQFHLQAKAFCEEQSESLWNYDNCKCEKRSLVARGAGEEPGTRFIFDSLIFFGDEKKSTYILSLNIRTAANCRDMLSAWSWYLETKYKWIFFVTQKYYAVKI